MRNSEQTVRKVVLAAIVVAAVFLLLGGMAHGHSWYAGYCCTEQDCRPAEPGEVTVTNIGYKVRGFAREILWNSSKIRQIPKMHEDGKYHLCIMRDETGNPYLRCLYIPRPSNSF